MREEGTVGGYEGIWVMMEEKGTGRQHSQRADRARARAKVRKCPEPRPRQGVRAKVRVKEHTEPRPGLRSGKG